MQYREVKRNQACEVVISWGHEAERIAFVCGTAAATIALAIEGDWHTRHHWEAKRGD
jgi:hypothetical protein